MRIVDLSREIKNSKLLPPDLPKDKADSWPRIVVKRFQKLGRNGSGRNGSMLTAPIHSLTHIDFPYHKFKDGKKGLDYNLTSFLGIGQVTDSESNIPKSEIVLFKGIKGISLKTAKMLVNRKTKMVGTDHITIGAPEENTEVHRLLLKNDVLIMESLTNLASVEGRKFLLLAFPLKVNADASPARVVAVMGRLPDARGEVDVCRTKNS